MLEFLTRLFYHKPREIVPPANHATEGSTKLIKTGEADPTYAQIDRNFYLAQQPAMLHALRSPEIAPGMLHAAPVGVRKRFGVNEKTPPDHETTYAPITESIDQTQASSAPSRLTKSLFVPTFHGKDADE